MRKQAAWPLWSRGSKSLEARLDDPAVLALARQADVLIDTFRPGVLERHGLGHDQLAKDARATRTVAFKVVPAPDDVEVKPEPAPKKKP